MIDKRETTYCKFSVFFVFNGIFAAVAFLILIGMWNAIEDMQNRQDSVVSLSLEKANMAADMLAAGKDRMISLQKMIAYDDIFDRDEETLRYDYYGAVFIHAREQLLAQGVSPEEQEQLDKQSKAAAKEVPLQRRIIELAMDDRMEEANRLFVTESLPRQSEAIKSIGVLHDLQKVKLKEELEHARQEFIQSRKKVIWLASIAVLIATVVGIFVMRKMKRSEKEREEHTAKIESTNLALADSTEKLKESKMAAEVANRTKSEFLANMSHELRTPLNAVIGYSEMIKEELETRKMDDLVPDCNKVISSSKHLLNLISGILDLSKVEAGKMEVYNETINTHDIISDVVDTINPLVLANNNKLVVDSQPIVIISDSTKLKQILFNLLSNASKFTTNGTLTISSHLVIVDEEPYNEISVTDTGVGVDPAKLKELFEPFVQADKSTTSKYGGTGLGLTITKHFCELMGGTIEATSVLGKGTTFTIKIPQRVQEDSKHKYFDEQERSVNN